MAFAFTLLVLSADSFELKRPVVIKPTTMSPQETSPRSLVYHADEHWINDNVLIKEHSLAGQLSVFERLVPLIPGTGCEVKVEYSDPMEGAKHMVEKCKLPKEALPAFEQAFQTTKHC